MLCLQSLLRVRTMAESLKFEVFCQVLENIYKAPKEKKIKYLNKLIASVRESSNSLGSSFFPLIRLLLPQLDKERGPYGVKENTLAKTYIRILQLPKDGLDANNLIRFRSPAAGSSAGDFADVAYWVLKRNCREGGLFSIQEVDARLDKIAKLHATNKPRAVDDELINMIFNMSPDEQRWLIRLLLKNLRLGLGSNSVLNAIHPDAKELYDVCNNLRKVCETLQDPSKRLHEIEICLFDPCRPMLSERCDVLKVDALFSKYPSYFVERKHDGERFQVHIDNGSFRYFSRSGRDYTEDFGDSVKCGILTPKLGKQLNSHVKTCILDGEMMGWNPKRRCYVSKGLKFDVKHLREGSLHQACFFPFDVLMLNGEVLTNKPLQDRIPILKQIFTPLEGVIMDTPQKSVTESSEVIKALNNAIDSQEEGLILKHPMSIYKPATRTGGWYKIKPEYTAGLTDDLDLLIMGGYYGEGRRKANISHFLVGVAVNLDSAGDKSFEVHSVGRVGSGYTREELLELLEKLSPHWRSVKGVKMPNKLVWTKERPDVWIEPCNSQILQVKATEIVQSELYKTGYTLRFPRVEKVRYDKSWSECCTLEDFEKLRCSNAGKLANKHVSSVPYSSPSKRQRTKAAPVVGKDYQAADLSSINKKGSILAGREICVLSGNELVSKQDLEKRIHEHGGSVVQHRGPETFCVIAGKKDFRFRNVLNAGDVDVVNVEWLLHVLDEGKKLDWGPQDLLAMSAKTREVMEMKYDNFFDSYHHPTNVEALKLCLEKVSEQGASINLLPSEMGDLDIELFSGVNEFAVFRCCVAHFVDAVEEEKTFALEILKAMFRFQGGRISEIENSDMTHVVIEAKDEEKYKWLQEVNRSRPKKFLVVTHDWIESCWANRRRLNEKDFHPRSSLYNSKGLILAK